MAESILEFTGERFTPECVREIWYEHWHRYAWAASLAAGRRVLDAACGEGYGSAMLAQQSAAQVLGLDISSTAVEHARARYCEHTTLRFDQADVTRLDALPDASFDLICSFETLEHVPADAQERMLDGFARLLAPNGLLLISTPDKRTYSDLAGFDNEFHTRELYEAEFRDLLAARFPHSRLWGQKLVFQSLLWDPRSATQSLAAATYADQALVQGLNYAPLYWLAACSQSPIESFALADVHLFGDAAESVYSHYNGEVRRNMSAGHRIQELEAQVDELQKQLAQLRSTG